MSDLAVEAKDLSVRFGDHRALDGISFELPKGGFLSIIGPNGAGKTTLLKTVLGLIKPTSGSVSVKGQMPASIAPGVIGYVPQVKMLDRTFPAKTVDLVVSGLNHKWPAIIRQKDREKALKVLKRMGALHLAERRVGKLSGGELQRAYLARALMGDPEIIVLDEPATGIDSVGEEDMYMMLEKHQKKTGATVLIITHDLNAVCHLCSHALLINQKQVGFGKPYEALSEDNLRRAFGHVGHDHDMMLFRMGKHA